MAYFPFFVDIEKKRCLVIGGGKVAYRKAKHLLEYSENVTVVAPVFCEELLKLEQAVRECRNFQETDLEGVDVVIAATDDSQLNHKVYKLCSERHILMNSVDDIDNCSFIFPSLVRKKDITVGISTSGKAPVYAQHLRKSLEEELAGDGDIVELLGNLRERVKAEIDGYQNRKKVYDMVLAGYLQIGSLPEEDEIQAIIEEVKHEN